MSVTGPGNTGGTRFDTTVDDDTTPATPADTSTPAVVRTPTNPTPASDPAAAALLAQLRGYASTQRPTLPSWLNFVDGTGNVTDLGRRVAGDGTVSKDDVMSLVKAAHDYGRMTSGEKNELVKFLNANAAKFEPAARQAMADFLGVANPQPGTAGPTTPTAPTTPTNPTTPTTPTTPTAPTTGPKASDIVPTKYLEKYGLDPNKMTTESKYDGPAWDVGYYPYSGDVQYVAFGKHAQVFNKDAAADAHGYFESYSNPPAGIKNGSWVASGSIRESDFERSTGIDVTGDRPIDNAAYKLLRESGAPSSAKFALRDAAGKQIAVGANDRLVPTVLEGGKAVEVEVDGNGRYKKAGGQDVSGDVVWRLKNPAGAIRSEAGDKSEDKTALTGAASGVKFDFLDATGRMVAFNPARDRIVPGFADGDKWQVFVKGAGTPPSYEQQTIQGGRVAARETLTEAQAKAKIQGKDVIHRVQSQSTGALAGDGKVAETYDMSWWGKCHNVASIGTSNMPRPKETVRVVTNLEAGDTLSLRYGDSVLKPAKDAAGKITGYALETRSGGRVSGTRQVSVAEANQLATTNKATAVIVKQDGSLKEAQTSTFSPKEVDALVSHIGDGGVIGKGFEGARYYAKPDVIVLKDGREVNAHILKAKTAAGKSVEIGSRSGYDYNESDRSALRAPGMTSRNISDGSGRQYAFNFQDMKKLNDHRSDDITQFTVVHPDGREETIDAANVSTVAWENKFDFRPDQIWGLHKTVGKDGSTVIERDSGTHVWNYTIHSVDSKPVKATDLSASERAKLAEPGMMIGSTGDENKFVFESKVDGIEYKYWVRFDSEGKVKDYSYLTDNVPDFVWTQHIKSAWTDKWTGESQAPGVKNEEIQRLYMASLGGFADRTLPGGIMSAADLKTAAATKPSNL